MRLLPNKISYSLNAFEMEILLTMLEEKIKYPLPVSASQMPPKDVLTFNYLLKFHLDTLRKKVRSRYEGTRALKYKISLTAPEYLAFYTCFKFGGNGPTDKNMLCYKISSEIDPNL